MRILLVEDDKELREATKPQLEKTGYKTNCCDSGQGAFYYAAKFPYDVTPLDQTLPQIDGLSVFNDLHRMGAATPVIITTTLDGINDRINSLDVGADDYLVKLRVSGKLLARTRVVTRRPEKLGPTHAKAYSSISPDPEKRGLTGLSGMVQLSKRESVLIEYLIRNAGQILARGMIPSYIQGPDPEVEEGSLDNHVYPPRRRLKSISGAVQIKTIHGTDYRLEAGGSP